MTAQADDATNIPVVAEADAEPFGESRWWPAAVLVVFLVLNITVRVWLPNASTVRVPWLLPSVEAVLLVVIVAADPLSDARRARWLHRIALTLVSLLVVAALWSTTLLVYDLIKGLGVTNSPGQLLATGGLVWLGNNLSFALLYWLMDSGGPIARLRQSTPIDFAFPQHLSPELAPPRWRPVVLDYLHLGFTNATAFSHRRDAAHPPGEALMIVQSTVALTLFGLIVARAVNAFT